jgi:hypothetical protein
MWGMSGVDEDDRLDSQETKQVIRRAARMAAPFKRTVAGAIGFSVIKTLGLLLGPVIVRYGIDDGISKDDTGVLRNAVIAYIVVVVVAYFASRQQFIYINRAGEAFLRLLRVRVFGHIQKQSLAFFDRHKSGVLVARMTADVESMAELVQWGLLQLVSAVLLMGFALILLAGTSMSPDWSVGKRCAATSGVMLMASESPRTAAATTLQKSMSKPLNAPSASMMPKPGSVSLPPHSTTPAACTAARRPPDVWVTSTVSSGAESAVESSVTTLPPPPSSPSSLDEQAVAIKPSAITAPAVRFHVEAFPLRIMYLLLEYCQRRCWR